MKPASSRFLAEVRMTLMVFHRPADSFWTCTRRPPGPLTYSASRSPTEFGARRAALQPTTFVDLGASVFAQVKDELVA